MNANEKHDQGPIQCLPYVMQDPIANRLIRHPGDMCQTTGIDIPLKS